MRKSFLPGKLNSHLFKKPRDGTEKAFNNILVSESIVEGDLNDTSSRFATVARDKPPPYGLAKD